MECPVEYARCSVAAGPEAGRERVYDEDSGITWVDFTEIIRQASAGGRAAAVAADVATACVRGCPQSRRPLCEASLTQLARCQAQQGGV